jgi:hypothetical protein
MNVAETTSARRRLVDPGFMADALAALKDLRFMGADLSERKVGGQGVVVFDFADRLRYVGLAIYMISRFGAGFDLESLGVKSSDEFPAALEALRGAVVLAVDRAQTASDDGSPPIDAMVMTFQDGRTIKFVGESYILRTSLR